MEPSAMRQPPPKQVSSAGWSCALKGSFGLAGNARITHVMAVAKSSAPKPAQITRRAKA